MSQTLMVHLSGMHHLTLSSRSGCCSAVKSFYDGKVCGVLQVTVAKRMEERKLKLPLLIGGATTSKMHTAVKLVTQYSGPVVHVLDASRSVPVAQTLLDKTRTAGFVEDVREVRPLTNADLITTFMCHRRQWPCRSDLA